MTLDLRDAPVEAPPEPTAPESGVIEEARRRRQSRRRTIALTVPFLALFVGVLAAILSGGPPGSRRQGAGRGPRTAPFLQLNTPTKLGDARISPALTGGTYGWNVNEGNGGGSCCTVPVRGDALQAETLAATGKTYESAASSQARNWRRWRSTDTGCRWNSPPCPTDCGSLR